MIISLLLSRLDFANATLTGIPAYLLQRLQLVLNAAVRQIFSSSRFSHISPLLCWIHWLNASERITYKVAFGIQMSTWFDTNVPVWWTTSTSRHWMQTRTFDVLVWYNVKIHVIFGVLFERRTVDKKQTYMKIETCKLHSRVFWIFLPNFIKSKSILIILSYISPLENLLPRSARTTLAQLHSGHCRLLNSYKARIISGISDVCPECGVALWPHSIEHLFNCQSNPTQLTVEDLWDDPAAVADFLNLENWRKETSRRAITTTTTYSSVHCRWQSVSFYSRSSVEQSSIACHCCPLSLHLLLSS